MFQLAAETEDQIIFLIAQQLIPQFFFRDDRQLPRQLRHAFQIIGVRVPQHAVLRKAVGGGAGKTLSLIHI